MIEEKISLAVQDLLDRGGQYLMIIAVEPQVRMLSDVRCIVASIQCTNVIDHSKQDVFVVRFCQVFTAIPPSCYERSHVNDFRKVNSGSDLLMKTT